LKGISIKEIHYSFINVEKLYIKIDKKIIFKAKNIYITKKSSQKEQKNEKINFKETTKLIKKTLQYLSFFQEINIQNLNINKNKINLISLHKQRLTVDTDDIFLSASLVPKSTKIDFKIYEVNIKSIDLILNNVIGSLHSDLLYLYINLKTNYKNSDIVANIKISNNNIYYNGYINNVSLNTLKIIKNKLKQFEVQKINIAKITFKGDRKKLKTNIQTISALVKNINIYTSSININFDVIKKIAKITNPDLYLNIENKQKIHLSKTNINYNISSNSAIIKNELISIENNKTKIDILNNDITYTNNISKFKSKFIIIQDPTIHITLQNIKGNYKKDRITILSPLIDIKNKNLHILISNTLFRYNLKTNKAFIKNEASNIKYKTLKNIQISTIKTYININKKQVITILPIIKLEKNININNTKIIFKNNTINVLFDTKALLSKQLTNILKTFNINIPIYQVNGTNDIKAKITYNIDKEKLNTNLKIKVNNSKLMLSESTALDIHHSELELKDTNITLKNTNLDYNVSIVNLNYQIDKGIINLDKSYIKTDGKFIDLNITDIVELKNYPEKLYIDLNGIDIFLKNLKTSILIHNNIIVNIDKLSKFYPYINYLQEYNLNEGQIKVDIGDNINIYTHISDTNQTILEENLTPLTKIDINTTIKDNVTNIKNKYIDINIFSEHNNTIIYGNLKNIDLNITQFMDKNSSEENKSSTNMKTNIKATNNYIVYNNLKLYSEKLSINSNTKNNKTFAHINSLYKDRNITIFYNDGKLKLYGLKIREKTFHDLTTTSFLKRPLIDLYVLKNKNSEILQGFVDIKKGYIKELKAFNNVLAFINLIPSLVTFQPVGFTSKGYRIKHGYIEYIFYNKILYFKTITIKGENLTFDGQGYVDLNQKIIKMNVNVNLIIKLVKDIPIVNYILLGKDGGITIKLTVDGDLKNPKVHTNTASNIIEAPLGIIKRALLTPFRPFMEEK